MRRSEGVYKGGVFWGLASPWDHAVYIYPAAKMLQRFLPSWGIVIRSSQI